jgi:hypothetical protein
MNNWTQPTFIEVDMSAEIGGYQGDDPTRDQPDQMPAFVADETPAKTTSLP